MLKINRVSHYDGTIHYFIIKFNRNTHLYAIRNSSDDFNPNGFRLVNRTGFLLKNDEHYSNFKAVKKRLEELKRRVEDTI